MVKVVEPESATLGLPFEEMEPLDANHQNMVRFTGFDDHIFRKVIEKLRHILSCISGNASAPNLGSKNNFFRPSDQDMSQLNCDNTKDYFNLCADRLPSRSRNVNSGLPLVIPLSLSKINSDQISISIRGLLRKCGIRLVNEAPFDWSRANIQIDLPRNTSIESLMNERPYFFDINVEDKVFVGLPELEPYCKPQHFTTFGLGLNFDTIKPRSVQLKFLESVQLSKNITTGSSRT